MNAKKITLGLLAGVMAATGVASTAYGAEHGEAERGGKHRGPQVSEEVRAELRSAFETGDYSEYTQIASENEFKRILSQEKFEEKLERHADKQAAREAVLDGDYSLWRSIVGDEKATDVDESNFSLLTDLAQAREDEDQEGVDAAKTALQEAGVEREGKRGGKNARRDREGKRPSFGERNGINKENVADMSESEKTDLLNSIIAQIKTRLGLN